MNDQIISALLAERESYARRGLKDRVKQVDDALKAYGYKPSGEVESASVEPSTETATVRKSAPRRKA